MIHIIFVSPDAFEKLGHQFGEKDGLGELRELLFPRRSEPNVLLADPHKANWFREVGRRIAKFPPQTLANAKVLLERLERQSLIGWSSVGSAPTNEGEWIKIARSNNNKYVDWAFTADAELRGESVEDISRISDDAWLKAQFPWSESVLRCPNSQLHIFRKLLLGYDWCIAELPYVEGDSPDEIVTLKQLIEVIQEGPASTPFALDLVTMERKKNRNWKFDLRSKLQAALIGKHAARSRRKIRLRVFALADCKDRYFTVGKITEIAHAQQVREACRCIAAQHVAIGRDRPTESSTWTLCSSVATKMRFEKRQFDMDSQGAFIFELS